MRATPTVGSYFPAERVKSFTSAIGSYTDTSLSIADSRVDQRVIEELEALQKGAKKIVEGYNVEANWISQFDPMFPKAGCCSNKSTCCKCACDEILNNAGTSTDRTQQIIAANSSNKDCSNITASTDFSKTLQIIDKSLKEHKLPIMVGVHHPTPIKDDDRKIIGWEETCSGNTPKETNHYVVIVGKQYDKTKKLHYYLFYEVGTEDAQMGKSSDNKLYIYSGLIKGLTKYKENIPSYYYILTEIRKNIGQIY
jgi:hypothetical protein